MSDQHRYLLLPLVQETKEYIDVFTNVGIPFEQIEQSIRDFVYDLVFTDPKNSIKDNDAYYIEHFDKLVSGHDLKIPSMGKEVYISCLIRYFRLLKHYWLSELTVPPYLHPKEKEIYYSEWIIDDITYHGDIVCLYIGYHLPTDHGGNYDRSFIRYP